MELEQEWEQNKAEPRSGNGNGNEPLGTGSNQWWQEGGRTGTCAPGGTLQGAAFRWAKIWNLAASGELMFALQTVIFYTL